MYSLSGSPSQYFDVLTNPEDLQKSSLRDFYGKFHSVGMVDYLLNLQPCFLPRGCGGRGRRGQGWGVVGTECAENSRLYPLQDLVCLVTCPNTEAI